MRPDECYVHICIDLCATLNDLERTVKRTLELTELAAELELPVDDQLTDHNRRRITVIVPSEKLPDFLRTLNRYKDYRGIHGLVVDCPSKDLVEMCYDWGQIGEYVEPEEEVH